MMKKLKWISQSDLDFHIENLTNNAKNASEDASHRRSKNVIDPFSSLLISATYSVDRKDNLEKILKYRIRLSWYEQFAW